MVSGGAEIDGRIIVHEADQAGLVPVKREPGQSAPLLRSTETQSNAQVKNKGRRPQDSAERRPALA